MIEQKNCRASLDCRGECPPDVECPYDNEMPLSKDRSVSVKRQSSQIRAQQNASKNLDYAISKTFSLTKSNATASEMKMAEIKCKKMDRKIRHAKSSN